MSKLQPIVAVGAGALTIIATAASLLGISAYRVPVQGDVVATVKTARFRAPVRDATVEILTPTAAVVTTLSSDDDGRIRYQLREGQYRLRVSHPNYLPDQKDIQVWAGQRADIRVTLASRPVPAPPRPVAPAPKPAEQPAESGMKKFFEKLGF